MWQCQNALRFNPLAAQTPFPPIVSAVRIFLFYYFFNYYYFFLNRKKRLFFLSFSCTKNTSTKTQRCWVHSAEKGTGSPQGTGALKTGKKIKGKPQTQVRGEETEDRQMDTGGPATRGLWGPWGAPGGLSVWEYPGSPPTPWAWGQFPKNGGFQPNLRLEAMTGGVVPPPPALGRVGGPWLCFGATQGLGGG